MSLLNRKRTSKRTEKKRKKKENSPGNEVPGQKPKLCHFSLCQPDKAMPFISNVIIINTTRLMLNI